MPGKAEHSRTFRFTPEDIHVLRECAERAESSEVAAVRAALRVYANQLRADDHYTRKQSAKRARTAAKR